MLHALGAASSVLDLLKALTPSKSQSTGSSRDTRSPFDLSGDASASGSSALSSAVGGSCQISQATMSALLAAQCQSTTAPGATSRADLLKDMFSQIDGNHDSKLSKSEFESALGAGGTNIAMADSVFGKMDKDGDGTLSLDEILSALKGKEHRKPHHAMVPGESGGSDPLLQALLPPVGSTATTTSPASAAATSSYNFVEQMVGRGTKSGATPLSLTA